MLKKIVVDEAGDSKFLPGSQVDTIEFQEVDVYKRQYIYCTEEKDWRW